MAGPGGDPGGARGAAVTGMDWKLARACLGFLERCQKGFGSEQNQQEPTRFLQAKNEIDFLKHEINARFDLQKEVVKRKNV